MKDWIPQLVGTWKLMAAVDGTLVWQKHYVMVMGGVPMGGTERAVNEFCWRTRAEFWGLAA